MTVSPGIGGMTDAFRRISQSLPETALITGILVHVLHVVFNTHAATQLDWHAFVGRFIIVPVIGLGMVTVHLANYPPRQWLWRAPVFALAQSVVEAFVSLALIGAGRERWGTSRAEMGDWPAIAGSILARRLIIICLFALILGAVVQWVRRREAAEERSHHHLPPNTPDRRKSS